MASVSIKTKKPHSVPCGISTGENLVEEPCEWTMQPVRRTKRNSRVSLKAHQKIGEGRV